MGKTKTKLVEDPDKNQPQEEVKGKNLEKKAKSRGAKYIEAKAKIDRNKFYSLNEALLLIRQISYSKFDSTLELHMVLRKKGYTTQTTLPFGTGSTKKIETASDSTIEKLSKGVIDFDILLATADMMPKLVPYAKVLGPRGLMPNPKNKTLIKSKEDASKFSLNSITIKTEKEFPLIHLVIGKLSQKDTELNANLGAILSTVDNKQIIKAYLKSSMSPSVKLKLD